MNCAICKGACCESFQLKFGREQLVNTDPDFIRFLSMRPIPDDGFAIRFEIACENLTPEGLCKIYDDRPQMCRDFEIGSERCESVVAYRRGKVGYDNIKNTPFDKESFDATNQSPSSLAIN